MGNLEGRIALITGAAGLGGSLAEGFARDGCSSLFLSIWIPPNSRESLTVCQVKEHQSEEFRPTCGTVNKPG